jgi:hypothetical protein
MQYDFECFNFRMLKMVICSVISKLRDKHFFDLYLRKYRLEEHLLDKELMNRFAH